MLAERGAGGPGACLPVVTKRLPAPKHPGDHPAGHRHGPRGTVVPGGAALPPREATGCLAAVDAARAAGILLIMAGHLPGLPDWLIRPIYSMHVPLFFWLAGWMLEPRRLAGSASGVAAGVGRSLLVPCALCSLSSPG
jgi:hypothetical protein